MNLSGSKVLVTGGAGFIGSHIIERLLSMGSEVTAIDRFDTFYPGKEKNVEMLSKNARFNLVRGDILDAEVLSSAMRGSDIVFHMAGQAGVRYCNDHPLKANSINVDGTLNVLMSARENKVKKVVYASSSSIYGDPISLPIDEEHPTHPNSPYGVSKLAAEHYCLAFNKVYGLNSTCLRFFSVYGPRGRPDQVIYAFAEKLARNEAPVIFGDGTYSRDFTYVSDVVNGTLLAAEKEESNGHALNIGFGRRISINELIKKILLAMDLEGKIKPIYAEQSKGDFSHTEADNRKARELLDWRPEVELDQGLKLFLDWFRENRRSA
ncbi:MAG: NAD-dependent epimerase/dehydratase family protein [Nitrososphaerales archaeon]